jgi:hypothetical protein
MMNDSTRVMRGPRPAWPPTARAVAAIIATAALALLAAACSGSPSATGSGGAPTAGGSANSPSAVAFSHCMRSRGVPNYPDPSSNREPPKTSPQQLGVSSSRFQAARRACQHLLPSTASIQQQTQQCMLTGDCPQALVRQILAAELRFARCMRSHGVPDWPDPTIDSEGRPVFNVSAHGLDPHHSPQLTTKAGECERLTGNPPVPMR